MGYVLEISFKLKLGSTYTSLTNTLVDICENNEVENYYFTTELEGVGKKIYKSLAIATISLKNMSSLSNLIEDLKKYKEYHVDCIYNDSIDSRILYASSYYLTHKMTKEGRESYREKGNIINI